jgi:thiamine-phosphate pyrophosphorylase
MSTHRLRGVYAILDSQAIKGRDPEALAAAAARGGICALQVRAKSASTREFINLARAVRSGLADSRVPLLINDRIDVALAVDADGVHIGRDDMEPALARRLLQGHGTAQRKIIGVTLKASRDLPALDDAADYGCIGGVFETRYKNNPDAPVGLNGFKALRAEAAQRCPGKAVGAIAGITAANAGPLVSAGADFVAVVGSVFDADDVTAAVRALAVAFANGSSGS